MKVAVAVLVVSVDVKQHLKKKTVRTVRVGEPRTATSTIRQFLISESLPVQFSVLYVDRDHKNY